MSDNLGVDLKPRSAFPEGVVASPTLGKLFEALGKAQADFGIAVFDSKNPHFKNEFASLRSIDDATKKQLLKVGVVVTQIPHSVGGTPFLFTMLGHTSGEFIGGDVELILDKKNMQGLGSAVTYARRYCKSAVINVVSDKDDDAEAASGRGHIENHHSAPPPSRFEEMPDYDEKPPTKTHLDDPGLFEIRFGKHKGKKIKDFPRKELVSYMNWMTSAGAGTVTDDGRKFLEQASRFLGGRTEI